MAIGSNGQCSGFGSPYVDFLVWGCKWTGGVVTYAFGSREYSLDGYTSLNLNASEKAMFREILQSYANVCGLSFKEVPFQYDSPSVNMVEWKVPSILGADGYTTLGWHIPMTV